MLIEAKVAIVAGTAAAVVAAVVLHYHAAAFLYRRLGRWERSPERCITLMVLGLLIAHVLEIWLFGTMAWALIHIEGSGAVVGYEQMEFLDFVYLSAVTYTTLGYGEVVPSGPIRFLYGTEALTGFMLITWSASVTFMEMHRHWETPSNN